MGGPVGIDDPTYARRRIDQLIDDRLDTIVQAQKETGRKVDRLEARLNYIAGGLAVLSVLLNLLGPALIDAVSK